jgi:hypothetical protein
MDACPFFPYPVLSPPALPLGLLRATPPSRAAEQACVPQGGAASFDEVFDDTAFRAAQVLFQGRHRRGQLAPPDPSFHQKNAEHRRLVESPPAELSDHWRWLPAGPPASPPGPRRSQSQARLSAAPGKSVRRKPAPQRRRPGALRRIRYSFEG